MAQGGRNVPACSIVLSFVLERVAWPPLSVCVFRRGRRGWESGGGRCISSHTCFPSHLRSDTAPCRQVSELPRPGANGRSCAYVFSQRALALSCPRGSGSCPHLMNISADRPMADGPGPLYRSGNTQGRVSLQVLGDCFERFHVVWLPEYPAAVGRCSPFGK